MIRTLLDEAALWALTSAASPHDLIRAACDALVVGVDSPSLRELAGLSDRDSWWTVQPLVEAALDELGLKYPGPDPEEIQLAAAQAMCARLLDGRITARDLATWAHRTIGHEGSPQLQPLVNLDDWLDIREYTGDTEATLEAETVRLAKQLLLGDLPLRASALGWEGAVLRHSLQQTTPKSAFRRLLARFRR